MAWPGGPSGDDRPPDPFADGPGDEGPLAVSVPDDASELAAEFTAYRREQRARRRRERFDRLTLARYWRPYGITGPVVIAALIVICSVGGLLLALLPNARQGQSAATPLGNATAHIGSVGGFLPDDDVYVDGSPQSAQALRPAVLVLVPATCACGKDVDRIAEQAGEFGLTTYVVSPRLNDPQLPALVHAARGTRTAVYDPGGKLRQAYEPRDNGVAVIVVRRDGVVVALLRNVTPDTSYRAVLAQQAADA